MGDKWFRKKKKALRKNYEAFVKNRTTLYDYTKGCSKVIYSTKGEYKFDSMAYKRALNYHKRTVIIPQARKELAEFIERGRMFYGRSYNFKYEEE